MNYEKIILELLDRIKVLEEKVKLLESKSESKVEETNEFSSPEKGISLVQRARDYIMGCKRAGKEANNDALILRCNDIQKDLGVKNRPASICQAMYDCMLPEDEVLEAPQSGKSTTVTVLYHLKHLTLFEEQQDDETGENEMLLSEGRTISLRQLRTGFEAYFNCKKPDYKYPGPLFGMAFYITKHNIGVILEDVFSGRVSLDEYADILYKHFYSLKAETATVRTSAYKDAMKNLLEYVHDMHFENIKIEKY